jgi:hypothetical protein
VTPRLRAAAAALLLLACRDRRATPDVARAEPVSPAPAPTPEPPPLPARDPWCWRAMPRASLRAIDPRGNVWAVIGPNVLDETDHSAAVLESDVPCPVAPAWSFGFDTEGRAAIVRAGRVYIRAGRNDPFRLTPLCTAVGGAPWSAMRNGGFGAVTTPPRTTERSLLLTNDRTGAMGWFAVTALQSSITEAVLDGDRSLATLSAGGHLVVVDQQRIVAGEVAATRSELFAGLRRTPAGVVAWRDASPTQRVIVSAEGVGGEFLRIEGAHPASRTLAVFRLDLARIVAVTDAGVELSTDNGERYQRVLSRRIDAEAGARAHAGWLPHRHPAAAFPDGLATDDCTPSNDRDGGG